MIVELTPLHLGTIASIILHAKIKATPMMDRAIPFPLPSGLNQCVHMTFQATADGLTNELVRCKKMVHRQRQNGFLCFDHQKINDPKVEKPAPKTQEQIELEVAEGVVLYEKRALDGRKRLRSSSGFTVLLQSDAEVMKLSAARIALNKPYDEIDYYPEGLTQEG